MDGFHWEDPLHFKKLLTDQEIEVWEKARDFSQSKLKPKILKAFRDETFDPSVMTDMGEQGFLGMTLDGYGCAGLNNVCYGLANFEVERVDSAYRSALSVQSGLAMWPVYAYGSDEQKERLLPGMAKGEIIGTFSLTEPFAGSDPGSLRTEAEKVDGGYIINGAKRWSVNATIADFIIVWVRTAEDIQGFILEKGMKGLKTYAIEGRLSLRAAVSGAIELDNVFVPDENILPGAKGLKAAFGCLNNARFGISWGVLGAATECWHIARQYTLDREQFGRPLAANQLIQKKLVDMQTEITLALHATHRLAQMKDAGTLSHEAISLLKRNNCGKSLDIARVARDMLGANGIIDEYEVMRHMVNLESVNTYEGTHDVHALILGRAQTDLPAF